MAAQAVPCWQGARAFWGRDGGLCLASSHGVYTRHHRTKATAGTCWDGSLDLDFGGLGRGDKSVLMVLQVCNCGWMGICVRHSISLFLHISSCSFFIIIMQSDTSTDGDKTSKLKQHTWILMVRRHQGNKHVCILAFPCTCSFNYQKEMASFQIFSKEGRHLYNWYTQRDLFRLINSTHR